MNGKKAKALRGIARAATVGLPAVAYEPRTRDPVTTRPNPILLADCTRKTYKRLKREA